MQCLHLSVQSHLSQQIASHGDDENLCLDDHQCCQIYHIPLQYQKAALQLCLDRNFYCHTFLENWRCVLEPKYADPCFPISWHYDCSIPLFEKRPAHSVSLGYKHIRGAFYKIKSVLLNFLYDQITLIYHYLPK